MANQPWWWAQRERDLGFNPDAQTRDEKLQGQMRIPQAPVAAPAFNRPAWANESVAQAGLQTMSNMGLAPVAAPAFNRPAWANESVAQAGPQTMSNTDSLPEAPSDEALARRHDEASYLMGVPSGLQMVRVPTPTSHDPRARAWIGTAAPGGRFDQNAGPIMPGGPWPGLGQVAPEERVGPVSAPAFARAVESPMGRMLANSGVIGPSKADQIREDALAQTRTDRWSMVGGPSRARSALDALKQSREADRTAQRQIDVAQGTPQVAASAAGVGGWDPQANTGRGGIVSEIRAPNVVGATKADHDKVIDPKTGMKASELLGMWSRARPRSAADANSRMMLSMAINAANGDPEKIKVAQEMWGKDNPGDPQAAAFAKARLSYLGIDPEADEGVFVPPGGGGQTVGQSGGAGQAVGQSGGAGQAVGQSGGQTVAPASAAGTGKKIRTY